MNNLKASIIIPTKDKLSRLRLVLKFLEHQVIEGVEVIVVFDGCSLETIDCFQKLRFRFTPLQIVARENIGRSAARNLGIELAKGQIIIFLDDDRIPGEGFVRKHLEAQKEPCVLLGERHDICLTDAEISNLYFADDQQRIYSQIKDQASMAVEAVPKIRRRFLFKLNGALGWMNFYTGNVSLPRNILTEVGGFDENFSGWGHEDLELGYRLHKKGIAFIKNSGILNYHLLHQSNSREKFRDSQKNLKYMIGKCRKDIVAKVILRAMLAKIYLERYTRRI